MFFLKKTSKILSLIFAMLMVITAITPAFAGEAKAYTITNPYANINWDEVNTYKTALHVHTNASDGDPTLKQSLERHVECGFDIVANTDHGTVNYSWEYENPNKLIYGALSLVGKSEGDLEYLGKEGTFANGMTYTLTTESNGDDYLTVSNGSRLMRVPYGIEQNAVSANAHVNSWFVDYHNNFLTTYADAIKNASNKGGVCVINHPGEYSKARYEIYDEDAYDTSDFAYWYLVNKWSSLLAKYDRCIGVDVNSKGDGRTRFDRKLWDTLLERFTAKGKNIYAICSSDAHQLDKIDTGFTYVLMTEQTTEAMKSALLNGEIIGGSHCNGNPVELAEIAASLKEYYGETELYTTIQNTVDSMTQRVEEIENGTRDADDDIGITYSVLDNEGFYKSENQAMVSNVSVDEAKGTITVNAENALLVRWISDGKMFATTKGGESTINLDEYKDKIGSYVRAEVFGEGGFLYLEPFMLNAPAKVSTKDVVDPGFFDFGILDCLLAIFSNWGDILGRVF